MIEDLCRKEYGLDVQAKVVGKTVGAALYVNALFDEKGQIPKEVHDHMGKVMQVVTRVALSTDLPLDFCAVYLRDRNSPGELVITRSLDDTKKANADVIGIEESINRTLFGQSRYNPSTDSEDLNFTLKEAKLPDFLADQIEQRVRFAFAKDAKGDELTNPFALVDGTFSEKNGKRTFHFSVIGLKADDPQANILNIFRTVNQVLEAYRFKDFDWIEIQDYLNRQKLVLSSRTLTDFQAKRITEAEILKRFLSESQSIQEAFKLFGFNLPQENDAATPAATGATTPVS